MMHSMSYFAYPHSAVQNKMRYYLDHYTTVNYVSQYEWQVARHDLHRIINEHAPACSGFLISSPLNASA